MVPIYLYDFKTLVLKFGLSEQTLGLKELPRGFTERVKYTFAMKIHYYVSHQIGFGLWLGY